jgi:hypothetical protein
LFHVNYEWICIIQYQSKIYSDMRCRFPQCWKVVIQVVTPHRLIHDYQCFGWTCCLHLLPRGHILICCNLFLCLCRYMIRKTLERLQRRYALINIPVNLTYVPVTKINQPPWLGW